MNLWRTQKHLYFKKQSKREQNLIYSFQQYNQTDILKLQRQKRKKLLRNEVTSKEYSEYLNGIKATKQNNMEMIILQHL